MNNRSSNSNAKHLLKALETTDNLITLINSEELLSNENIRGILMGVLQQCVYKLQRRGECENKDDKTKRTRRSSALQRQGLNLIKKYIMTLAAMMVLGAVAAGPVKATIILSTESSETLGGLSFGDGDLASYDPTTDTATLLFSEALFGDNEDIDAVHILDNGNIILSTGSGALLGGLSFGDGDLVEYNPLTDVAVLYFSEALFGSDENIDAVHILDNGNIILSTADGATLGGLSFTSGGLIEYNPATNIGVLFFDGALFDGSENIDAVHILDNGNIILSTAGAATLGGLTFQNGDLIEYNPTTDIATLYFSESLFSSNANIDAVYVTSIPEPATIAMFGFGGLILICQRRRKRHSRNSCS